MKILKYGIVKGFLIFLFCSVLLSNGAFVKEAVADGGKYILNLNKLEQQASQAVPPLRINDPVSLEVLYNEVYNYAKKPLYTGPGLSEPEATELATQITNEARGLKKGEQATTPECTIGGVKLGYSLYCFKAYDGGETPSAAALSLKDSVVALNTAYLLSVSNLSRRMGDLRGGEESNIPWVRFARNNNQAGSAGFNGNLYQVGYDREIARDKKSRQLLGISLDINEGSTKLTNGRGDMDGVSVGIYYTKIYECGHYFDFILRQGRFSDEVKTFYATASNPLTEFDYAINATTISGEYGYRWKLGKHGFYLEPQIEAIWGYLSGANITTKNNEKLTLDSSNKFLTRLGVALGKKSHNFNYYARVSQFFDWGGAKSTITQDDVTSSVDQAKNWWEVSLGGGWHFSNLSYFYAEISKQFKDIQNSLNFNIGFRFSL